MITTETPYKLAEIIRDTWPNLYRPPKKKYNEGRLEESNDRKPGTRGKCDERKIPEC